MKIKITEPGWAGYTGLFGYTEFVDGISVEDVGTADSQRLASLIQIENVEDGTNPSVTQHVLNTNATLAAVNLPITPAESKPDPARIYTASDLAAVADSGGIKAIRGIADDLGLKGNSISALIGAILDKQSVDAAAAQVAKEAAEAEAAAGDEPEAPAA